jgi:hypothetical protein
LLSTCLITTGFISAARPPLAAFFILTEPSWSHGYFPNALYISGFYREMAPNWLDFAALVKGHRPTRREGQPFRYLELSSALFDGVDLARHLGACRT